MNITINATPKPVKPGNFNYGNIETAKTFVKGISLCLPSDTDATFYKRRKALYDYCG